METFIQDLKHSLRVLRKSPSFTITAVAALAFGIGANTAIFSVVNAILLKPVAAPDPDRVVVFTDKGPQGEFPGASPAEFAHWRQLTDVVREVSVSRTSIHNYTGGDVPQQLRIEQVSADYFHLLGAPLVLGRSFTAEEDRPRGEKTVVLSHRLWNNRFARDPEVLGRTVLLSGDPYRVIGVVGPSFDFVEFGPPPDAWIAFQLDPESKDQGHYFVAIGRLAPGVALEAARARVAASFAEFNAKNQFPDTGAGAGFGLQSLQETLVKNVRQTLLVLLGAVGFVLLIACANVANLLLVRAAGRRREIALRAALGAGRGRIIRQLLTESVLLSLIGGVIGLGLGALAIRALLSINTAGLPRIGEHGELVSLDWRVALFTVGVCLVTGVLFGLLPALQSSHLDLSATLKEGGRSGTGHRGNRARSVLVVAEVALALILLVGSALLIRTSMALASVNPGFDSRNVLTMRMSLTGDRYKTSESVDRMVRDGVDRLKRLPGVENASATCCVPLEGGYGLPFKVIGRPLKDGPFHGGAGWLTVSAGYFEVFKIAVKRGRTFNERDNAGGPPVVIINEAMARETWPDGDPLNDRLIIGKGVMKEFDAEPERQIIGVVSDVRDNGLNKTPQPAMYIPQAQMPDAVNALNSSILPLAWVVRTTVEPNSLSRAVSEQLREATGLPVAEIRSMDKVVSNSTSRERFNMLVMTIFGGFALLLAAIGIYGLMSYSVEQRTQEIGIRLALGAEPGQVRKMIVRQGMLLVAVGLAVGMGAAFGLAKVIASFLFGVEAWDPLVFVSIPVLLAAVALLAVWRPARTASRVDPMSALRSE